MSQQKPKISTSFSYETLEETLDIKPKGAKLQIGIPKEIAFQENRIALTPDAVSVLVSNGHEVTIEHNAGEAALGAKAMEDAIGKLDKSLLTAEQKTAYDANEEEMIEHAEHIAKNGDNVKHQRSHFVQMSEVVYEVGKNFGAGRPVYHDHCPMAFNEKGAMWLSENKDIKNPYFGEKMLTCGTVEEVIEQ